jgi:hypothetical protein
MVFLILLFKLKKITFCFYTFSVKTEEATWQEFEFACEKKSKFGEDETMSGIITIRTGWAHEIPHILTSHR